MKGLVAFAVCGGGAAAAGLGGAGWMPSGVEAEAKSTAQRRLSFWSIFGYEDSSNPPSDANGLAGAAGSNTIDAAAADAPNAFAAPELSADSAVEPLADAALQSGDVVVVVAEPKIAAVPEAVAADDKSPPPPARRLAEAAAEELPAALPPSPLSEDLPSSAQIPGQCDRPWRRLSEEAAALRDSSDGMQPMPPRRGLVDLAGVREEFAGLKLQVLIARPVATLVEVLADLQLDLPQPQRAELWSAFLQWLEGETPVVSEIIVEERLRQAATAASKMAAAMPAEEAAGLYRQVTQFVDLLAAGGSGDGLSFRIPPMCWYIDPNGCIYSAPC